MAAEASVKACRRQGWLLSRTHMTLLASIVGRSKAVTDFVRSADLRGCGVVQEGRYSGLVALQRRPHKLHVLRLVVKPLLRRPVISALYSARLLGFPPSSSRVACSEREVRDCLRHMSKAWCPLEHCRHNPGHLLGSLHWGAVMAGEYNVCQNSDGRGI